MILEFPIDMWIRFPCSIERPIYFLKLLTEGFFLILRIFFSRKIIKMISAKLENKIMKIAKLFWKLFMLFLRSYIFEKFEGGYRVFDYFCKIFPIIILNKRGN